MACWPCCSVEQPWTIWPGGSTCSDLPVSEYYIIHVPKALPFFDIQGTIPSNVHKHCVTILSPTAVANHWLQLHLWYWLCTPFDDMLERPTLPGVVSYWLDSSEAQAACLCARTAALSILRQRLVFPATQWRHQELENLPNLLRVTLSCNYMLLFLKIDMLLWILTVSSYLGNQKVNVLARRVRVYHLFITFLCLLIIPTP